MTRLTLTALALALSATVAHAAPNTADLHELRLQRRRPLDAQVKVAPGQYRNPILKGFYPDPSVTRVGKDYYLVNSTFAWFPGLPVFHSTDLVHWTQIGNAIDRPGMLDFKRLGLSRAVFAPSIEHHDGTVLHPQHLRRLRRQFPDHRQGPQGPVVGSGVAADRRRHRRLDLLRRRRQAPGSSTTTSRRNPPSIRATAPSGSRNTTPRARRPSARARCCWTRASIPRPSRSGPRGRTS
jgi:hypothetical protein